MLAACSGSLDLVSLFVEKGADINAKDKVRVLHTNVCGKDHPIYMLKSTKVQVPYKIDLLYQLRGEHTIEYTIRVSDNLSSGQSHTHTQTHTHTHTHTHTMQCELYIV